MGKLNELENKDTARSLLAEYDRLWEDIKEGTELLKVMVSAHDVMAESLKESLDETERLEDNDRFRKFLEELE
jgi:hypothetical protein